MLPVSSVVAHQQSAAEEWQALAQRMGGAYAVALSSGGDFPQITDTLQPSLRHVPLRWTPVSADQSHPLPQRVVIYDATECEWPPAADTCMHA
jgi:hypothetical protein